MISELKIWTIDEFKSFVRKRIDKHFYSTPSMIVLMSFYIAEVTKPKDITARTFDWLRSIAEQEIQIYKSKLV